MIRVLIAEDSATCLGLLTEIIATDPRLSLIATANHGAEAVRMTRELRPDVVVMDIHMPVMDGFEATRQIMTDTPTPIVIVSGSVDVRQVKVSMQALRLGALALLPKPTLNSNVDFDEMARQFTSSIRSMAGVRVVRRWSPTPDRTERSIPAPPPVLPPPAEGRKAELVAIATSTGGPGALYRIFSELSGDFPVPILVVQHIAHGFVGGLAAWLDSASKLRVKVATPDERIKPGWAYIAPDDFHLGLRDRDTIEISAAKPIAGFRPSGTFLFESVARVYGNRALALVLTGMGEDGLTGLRAMHAAGAQIIAQDEETSVVFGMPGVAVAAGIADSVLPLDLIAGRLLRLCGRDELRMWKQHD
jgi:two-component system, chemotaxis family, protein-glutamate methylesterase/glutaminase